MDIIENRIDNNESQIHNKIAKLANPDSLEQLVWFELQKVLTMDKGDSFGERALIKNEDRSATIICSQDCAFATLSRIDYNWILGLA